MQWFSPKVISMTTSRSLGVGLGEHGKGAPVDTILSCPHWYLRIPLDLPAPCPLPSKLEMLYLTISEVSFSPLNLSVWKILNSSDSNHLTNPLIFLLFHLLNYWWSEPTSSAHWWNFWMETDADWILHANTERQHPHFLRFNLKISVN